MTRRKNSAVLTSRHLWWLFYVHTLQLSNQLIQRGRIVRTLPLFILFQIGLTFIDYRLLVFTHNSRIQKSCWCINSISFQIPKLSSYFTFAPSQNNEKEGNHQSSFPLHTRRRYSTFKPRRLRRPYIHIHYTLAVMDGQHLCLFVSYHKQLHNAIFLIHQPPRSCRGDCCIAASKGRWILLVRAHHGVDTGSADSGNPGWTFQLLAEPLKANQ